MSLRRLMPRMGYTSSQLTPADEMLRARLIRQAVVLGPLPIAIYVAAMSTDFRRQWLSVNAARVTGFSPDAFVRRPRLWVSRLHADDRAQVLKEYRRLADGIAHTTEYRWRTADGAYRWFLDAARVLRDTPGKPNRIVGVWLDITRRKLAEEARQRSERQLRRLLHEREQLGRDLHDDIIQSLYAVGLSLGECRQVLDTDCGRAKRLLTQAAAGLNSVLRDIRRFISRMEPVSLGRQSLGTAVRSLARKMNATGAMHWTVRVDSHANDRLKPAEAASLLQVIREAMSNSVRHSKADLGLVSVQVRHAEVVACVEDNGEGFSLNTVRDTSGRGIENITARADQLAAELKINSVSGQGTQIRLRIPRGKHHTIVRTKNPRPRRG